MTIVPYDLKYRQSFIDMNMAWITAMFAVEATDEREFDGIDESIAQGGQIFFALDEDGQPMACCMIAPRADGDWEIMKFAARGMYTGKGAGSACLQACIDYARERELDRIIVVSNRRCAHAVSLYRRFGFQEMPVDRAKFPFERADIAFELALSH